MSSKVERAWAEINLSAISHNLKVLRAGRDDQAVIAVVKADAYGHGAIEVSRRLVSEGVDILAVASVEEGCQLRAAGIKTPVLLLGAYMPQECCDILEADLTSTVQSLDFATALDEAAADMGLSAAVHIEIDTGMGRLGIPAASAIETVERISVLPNLVLDGVYTHFAESECEDKSFTLHQIDEFRRVVDALAAMGITFTYQHTANSAACLDVPESIFNCLRPGIALYGLCPGPCCGVGAGLKPAMEFCARVLAVRDFEPGWTIGYGRTHHVERPTRVAVLSAGYADGYDRRLSRIGAVTLRGASAAVLGTISMDLTSVDVTGIDGVEPGDKAVLFSADPAAPNSVDNLAAMTGTIPYVLTCGVSKRVARIYLD